MGKDAIRKKAEICMEEHKKIFENWNFGEIEKSWLDNENNLCIKYQSGNWFHYNERGEWW